MAEGSLDDAWRDAEATAKARGGMLYEVKRRWEGGVRDGWYAMAVRDGYFWREQGDTPTEALSALAVSMGGPGVPSRHDLMKVAVPAAGIEIDTETRHLREQDAGGWPGKARVLPVPGFPPPPPTPMPSIDTDTQHLREQDGDG